VLFAVAAVAPLAAIQSQDSLPQATSPDVEATIRAATAQKNHDMLETAAAAFEKLRQFDTAQRLLESAASIRAEVSGQQSVAYGLGLLKLGELEQRRNQDASAEDFFQRAAQILGDRPEAAKALIPLGISALGRKDYTGSVERFQHAQRIDPSQAGAAAMWIGVVREREQNFTEAEAQFKSALAIQNPRSADAATTMVLYAQMLRRQGKLDEATELEKKSTETRNAVPRVATAVSSNTSPTSGGVYRVGGGVTAPALVFKKEPEYSEVARAAKYQGTVTLYVEVGPDGFAHNMRVLKSLGLGLDEKAMDAVSQWQFRPGMKAGVPVTVAASIEVNFRLL
jgi:TonB family protein